MKILITGSSGLIGSSICEEFKNLKYKIIQYDIKKNSKLNIENSKLNKFLDQKKPDIISGIA